MTRQAIHYDSTHSDTYSLVGFSRCLHLWGRMESGPYKTCFWCFKIVKIFNLFVSGE